MFKQIFVPAIFVALVGCGGGSDQPDDDLQFGQTLPSEATLCTFTMGVTTRGQVEAVLGEPTYFTDDPSGSSVQYWYGNAQLPNGLKTMLMSFDENDVFEFALLSQIPYPQCWREQDEAADAP
jgi:hypothetical protein